MARGRSTVVAALGLAVACQPVNFIFVSADAATVTADAATEGGSPNDATADSPGSGDTGAEAGCMAAAAQAASLFVDSTAPAGGSGLQSAPFKTINAALSVAPAQAVVWVCNGSYPESVSVGGNIKLFGGFDCNSWQQQCTGATVGPQIDPMGTVVTASEAPALEFTGAEDAEVAGFTFALASGTGATVLVGGSSVLLHDAIVQGGSRGVVIASASGDTNRGGDVTVRNCTIDGGSGTEKSGPGSAGVLVTSGGTVLASNVITGGSGQTSDANSAGSVAVSSDCASLWPNVPFVAQDNRIAGGSGSSTAQYGIGSMGFLAGACSTQISGGFIDGGTGTGGTNGVDIGVEVAMGSAALPFSLSRAVVLGGTTTVGAPTGLWIHQATSATVVDSIIHGGLTTAMESSTGVQIDQSGLTGTPAATFTDDTIIGGGGTSFGVYVSGSPVTDGGSTGSGTTSIQSSILYGGGMYAAALGLSVCTPARSLAAVQNDLVVGWPFECGASTTASPTISAMEAALGPIASGNVEVAASCASQPVDECHTIVGCVDDTCLAGIFSQFDVPTTGVANLRAFSPWGVTMPAPCVMTQGLDLSQVSGSPPLVDIVGAPRVAPDAGVDSIGAVEVPAAGCVTP